MPLLAKRRFELYKRVKRARRLMETRRKINYYIDELFWAVLGRDFHLPKNSNWALFAELFWVQPEFCPICFFWRGVTFGVILGALPCFLLFLIF